jgi:hypothetical protein
MDPKFSFEYNERLNKIKKKVKKKKSNKKKKK